MRQSRLTIAKVSVSRSLLTLRNTQDWRFEKAYLENFIRQEMGSLVYSDTNAEHTHE